MKRYNAVVGGVYDNSVMVEEKGGDYVWYEEVEHLEAINAELLEALRGLAAVVGLTPIKGNLEALQEAYEIVARAAIAKAKGEVMP